MENGKRHSVKISEIKEICERRWKINNYDLNEVDFIDDNGEVLDIPKELRDEFGYTGLSLCDFITSGFYLEGYSNEQN